MRMAYADPPYFGQGKRHYGKKHAEAAVWDDPRAHRELVERLCGEYPDGWALSLSSPSLKLYMPWLPEDHRIGAWVKPFAIFKPNVNPGYCWEPVIFRGGRKRTRDQPTTQDFISANITLKKGLSGAKPREFCFWMFEILNVQAGDTLDDLFPGTGIVGCCFDEFTKPHVERQLQLIG